MSYISRHLALSGIAKDDATIDNAVANRDNPGTKKSCQLTEFTALHNVPSLDRLGFAWRLASRTHASACGVRRTGE